MAQAGNFYIGANDEHGLNPPTGGKRTPVMPYIDRSFYENEYNRKAKQYFMIALSRCGFNVFDVKPEWQDVSINTRVSRVNARNLSLVTTFAYNAYGSGTAFNNVNGYLTFYSDENSYAQRNRLLAYDVSAGLSETLPTNNLGIGTLTGIGMLRTVRCPAVIIEGGFMTNFYEAKLMMDPDFQKAAGEGACMGVCDFLDVAYVPQSAKNPTLRQGARGKSVQYMQYLLRLHDFEVSPDGVFGPGTAEAVRAFQTFNGLTVDGIVGKNTWSAFLIDHTPMPTLRRGASGAAVAYLQQKLLSKLYNAGAVDGVFGGNTERAVLEFQTENCLSVDGIVGKNTWGKLMPMGGGRPMP
ncbi:MAG: peptidoglycan-binding protein [Clostridiales bacterium]|jgi:hypothetical protein|nr:peptidoglycan-binding protein [Clostridiales bacterium]